MTNLFSVIYVHKIKDLVPFDYEIQINHYQRPRSFEDESKLISTEKFRLLKDDVPELIKELNNINNGNK